MKKNLLCLVSNIRAVALCLAVVCSTIASWAIEVGEIFSDGTLEYKVTSVSPNECSVYKYRGSDAEVQIPETVSYNEVELKVTSIGKYAFYRCTSLSSITIPSSVTSIGESAFYRCTSLSSITIPATMTNIGDYAFRELTALQKVTCKGTTPPICDIYAFNGTDVAKCKLIVPKGSGDAYKTADVWRNFGSIKVKKINIEYNDGTATLSIDRLNVKKLTFTED